MGCMYHTYKREGIFIKSHFKKISVSIIITLLVIAGCTLYFSNKISFKTYEISVCWAVQIDDPKVLYEHSDAIFIGKVEKKIGQVNYAIVPETQFSVKVQKIIKGSPKETIEVNQEGGIKKYAFEIPKGTKMLEIGRTYFFAARYDKEKDIYTIAPVYGDVLINNAFEIEEYIRKFEKFKE